MIKNYNQYNEEINWKNLNPFKKNKEKEMVTKFKIFEKNEDIDPFGEEN